VPPLASWPRRAYLVPILENYDLIIVGGGPSGATAALYAQRHGLKTLLLDKEQFPRDKVCGDAISGKSVALLHELGLIEQVRQLPGAAIDRIVFGSPDNTAASIDLSRYDFKSGITGQTMPMRGFVIRRAIFDHFLFEQAKAASTRCIEGFSVRELLKQGEQVCGVRGVGADGKEMEFAATIVLGCDGFNSIVARRGGLYRHDSAHTMVSLRQYWQGVDGLTDQIELHFIDEVHPGYFWIFPVEKDSANIGICIDHDEIKKRGLDLKASLAAAIASPAFRDRFANASPQQEPAGWNLPVGSKRRTIHGNGFLLLGDAASLIDPFTGEGIGNALYSARLAVEIAVEAGQANDFSAHFLRRYEDRLWHTLGSELRLSTQLHGLGNWSFLMNLVIRKAARNKDVSDLICGMMANAVPRAQMLNPLFYLKLLFS